MAEQWYYTQNDQRFGPVSGGELKQLAMSGQLQPSDLVWKEGLPEWKAAKSFPALFTGETPPAPAVAATGKKILAGVGRLAEKVSQVASEAVAGDKMPGGLEAADQPAIFLQSDFFGGRTRIGTSLASLSQFGGKVAAALFSWFYLLSVLKHSTSEWQFLPFQRTEFVRITLSQAIRWERVFPAFAAWIVLMLLTLVGSVVLGAINPLLSLAGFFGGYVLANIIACQMLVGLDESGLHRSRIALEYGYPRKVHLLHGLSDAPVGQQMEGVLKLCQAISKVEFGRWDQFTAHGEHGHGLLGGVFQRIVSMIPGMHGDE
jgi:hypothetical protein